MTTPTARDHRAALASNLRRRKLPTYADAVLRLPVIPTCVDCRHWRSGTSFLDEPDTTRCWKVSPPMPIDVDAPPPTTCPLRGGAR